uniref:Uncharacterized protein n=1 Tax=Arundo donax TaxID=35708 RepID=A0A0A9CJU4_ARUDO
MRFSSGSTVLLSPSHCGFGMENADLLSFSWFLGASFSSLAGLSVCVLLEGSLSFSSVEVVWAILFCLLDSRLGLSFDAEVFASCGFRSLLRAASPIGSAIFSK